MLRRKDRTRIQSFTGFIVLITLAASSTYGQYEFGRELEAVPVALRSSLSLRLQEYSEYERNREFDKQYALFSEDALRSFHFRTKEAYVSSRQDSYPLLISFKPLQSSYDAKQGISHIDGEATLQWKDKTTTDRLNVTARLKNGEWFLSEYTGVLEEFPGVEELQTTTPTLTNAPVPKKLRKP